MFTAIMGAAPGMLAGLPAVPSEPPKRKYAYSKKFFEQSIRDAVRESIFSPVTLGERHNVALKPKFNTACWAFLPPHRIYIGTELFEKPMVKDGLTEEQQAKYIANHYHHELGHALFTERDMKRIQRSLKTMDCPFNLYNLFEDAYMEKRYSREAEYQFEWLTLETLDFNPRAESLLFALIQAEGDIDVVKTALDAWKPEAPKVDASDPMSALALLFAPNPDDTRATLQDMLPRVIDYYLKIIAVKESMHLMPILKAWMDEFGRPPPMGNNGAGGGLGDMQHSADLMTGQVSVEEFEAEVEELKSGSDDEDKPSAHIKGKAEPVPDHKAIAKKGEVLGFSEHFLDMPRAEAIANKLKKFFIEKSRVVSTRTPQRRMSARHFALDRAPYRKTEIEGRGTKRVFLVIDCSGSMGGFHLDEGRILVMALSILARQGFLEGHVALSATNGSQSNWELFALPMAQQIIARIGTRGGEGLEYTMNAHMKLLQESDYVFVYTDGQITDKKIDKASFHRHGVYTWGLYAGETEGFMEKLMVYFDKAILRSNAEALVDAMLIQQK